MTEGHRIAGAAPLLGREELLDALRMLALRLQRRQVVARRYVFGGAAMALAHDRMRSTRDVDATYEPDAAVREEAWAVAAELGLPRSWLNDQATAYLPRGEDEGASVIFDHSNLVVRVASPEHLLASKASAARPGDDGDIRTLAARLQLGSAAEVAALHNRLYPDEPLGARQRARLTDLLG